MKCPCHSQKEYNKCCKPHHEGKEPKSCEALMRSRYCAYALGLVDFIVETSAKSLRDQMEKSEGIEAWKAGILAFSHTTEFYGLEVVEANENRVTFKAFLRSKADGQKGSDISFMEKSLFIKEPALRYLSGEVSVI